MPHMVSEMGSGCAVCMYTVRCSDAGALAATWVDACTVHVQGVVASVV